MTIVTFTVGPPGAGKTAWAQSQVAEQGPHAVNRVNLDDWFTMVHGRSYGQLSSDDVRLAKQALIDAIRTILESGRDVIVDNTHLSTNFPSQVRDAVGDVVEYRIKDFTVVPLDRCVEQDAVRERMNPQGHVGETEVAKQHAKGLSLQRRFGGPGMPLWVEELNRSDSIEPYRPDTALPKAVIVDIDGTLALATARGPYDSSLYHLDELEHRLATLVNDLTLTHDPYQIIILTGRFEEHRSVTDRWLEEMGVRWDEFYMRSDGDTRRDNVVKLELFNKHIRDRFNVIAAFDDRDRVVRLWRRLDVLCCQVNYGSF